MSETFAELELKVRKLKSIPKIICHGTKKCTVVKILQIAILLYIFFDTFVIF